MHENDSSGSTPDVAAAKPGAPDAEMLPWLRRFLKRGKDARALALLGRLMAQPDMFFAALGAIRRPFLARQRGDLLTDFLLGLPSEQLRQLGLIATLLELSAQPDARYSPEEMERLLEERGVLRDVRFFPNDYLVRYAQLGRDAMRVLAACKYGDGFYDSREGFWDTVARTADRLYTPVSLVDQLFDISRFKAMGRAAWEADLRAAFAIDHITLDYRFVRNLKGAAKWTLERRREALAGVDAEAAAEVFAAFDAPEGLVLSTFHGGLLAPATEMYDVFFPRGEHLDGTTRRKGDAGMAKSDQLGAGFAALKSLSNGGVVIVAPDGGRGKAASEITVAGRTMSFPDGAPFLAYEAGCRTGWFGAVRRGDRIVPEFVPGPRRQEGERYGAFKRRFFDFYAEQIERVLGGDPQSLALRPRWSKLFVKWPDSDEDDGAA